MSDSFTDYSKSTVGGGLQVTVVGSPVSTTTADQGTPAATVDAWPIKVTDGTETADVTAANALKVDGSAVTQPVSISGSVPVTGPLTDAQLRATPVPVSGTVAANAGSGTFAVSGTVTANAGSGTFAVSAASLPLPSGAAQEHTTAGSPSSVRLSDGSAFYKATTPSDTQPISGTVTANAGSGTFAVSGPLTDVQLRASAVPISAASLPLPTGAATSAKQPALGTAGSPSSDVITVQGVTSMTALKVDGSAVTQPVSGTVSATVSGTVAATQSGTWTVQPGNTANTTPWLSTISQGGNSATVSAGGALKVDGSAVTQPVSGTVTANAGSGTFVVSGTVIPFAALSTAIDGVTTLTSTGDNTLIAAGGAGTRAYITSISASNTSGTGVRIDFKDGATVKHSFYLAASGGGASHIFPFPWRLSDNGALVVAISASVTDVRVSANGFRG